MAVVVEVFLRNGRVDVNTRDDKGMRPLAWAVSRPDSEVVPVVKMFLERDGVGPDAKDNEGRTPLSLAARGGTAGVVVAFLQHGRVDVNAKDNEGWTPLIWAVSRNRGVVPVVRVLLQHDPDTKARRAGRLYHGLSAGALLGW